MSHVTLKKRKQSVTLRISGLQLREGLSPQKGRPWFCIGDLLLHPANPSCNVPPASRLAIDPFEPH